MSIIFLIFTSFLLSSTVYAEGADYHKIHLELERAWELTKGSEEITVATLSTGLNYRLPEFQGKVLKDPETGEYGYDATLESGDPFDIYGNGTSTASLVVGRTLGVAPDSKVIPIKVIKDKSMSTDIETLNRGIGYATKRKAKILLFTLGVGEGQSAKNKELCKALKLASNGGMLIVTAAGNLGKALSADDFNVWCKIKNKITVAATNKVAELSRFSSHSFRYVHTAAPGSWVKTMDHTGTILEVSGTSISAALTAGVAALVWSHHPGYSAEQVKEALIRGSIRSTGLLGLVTSNGILSAYGALTVELD